MRVFLTGVSGYLGSVVARRLAALPEIECITGVDIVPPQAELPEKVNFVQQDVRSPDLAFTMAGHDVVIHTAFIVVWRARVPAAERDDINLNGTRNVARAARSTSVSRIIHTSSVAAYGTIGSQPDPVTEDFPLDQGSLSWYYTRGKVGAERSLQEELDGSPILLTILRPTLIVGPGNRDTIPQLRANGIRIAGHDPIQQWVHEDDVAEAFAQAVLQELPGAYNVVPDDSIRMSETLRILGVTNPTPRPLWLARQVLGFRWRFLNYPTHPSWIDALWTFGNMNYSNAKLRATGWRPRFSSAEALRDSVRSRPST